MHTRSETWEQAVVTARNVDLIGVTELKFFFPDATVVRERLAGLTKSIIAVRGEPPSSPGHARPGAVDLPLSHDFGAGQLNGR